MPRRPLLVLCALAAALLVGVAPWACAPRSSPVGAAPVAVDIPPAPVGPADPEAEGDEPVVSDSSAKSPFAGRWQGTGVQNDGDTWPIVVEVIGHDESPCARVTYPPHQGWGLSCVCIWQCDAESSTPSQFVGVERIVEGVGNCIDQCTFEVNFNTGTLAFDCSFADVTATVELERVP